VRCTLKAQQPKFYWIADGKKRKCKAGFVGMDVYKKDTDVYVMISEQELTDSQKSTASYFTVCTRFNVQLRINGDKHKLYVNE
jgi:hypothetical protein